MLEQISDATLTPPAVTQPVNPLNLAATTIMDSRYPAIQELAERLRHASSTDRHFVQRAHGFLMENVKPAFTLNKYQAASETLRKREGSCSQRMACLEAVSRANGIGTRVRALWIDGRFWHPRVRLMRPFIPKKNLLAWPQFHLDGEWVDFDELYGTTRQLAAESPSGFTNADEPLFEAVRNTAVDFMGKSKQCVGECGAPSVDLSKFVLSDGGFYDTRDALYDALDDTRHSFRGKIFEKLFGGRKR